jgi:hypothetical protein
MITNRCNSLLTRSAALTLFVTAPPGRVHSIPPVPGCAHLPVRR